MLNIPERHKEIVSKFKEGKRAIFKASEEEMQHYQHELENAIDAQNLKSLEQIFCILANTQQKDLRFEEAILDILKSFETYNSDQIIMALSVTRKHIIEAKQINGLRQSANLLQVMEKLLYHSDHEVVEWTLRLIEEMGSQAIYFKRHFPKIMPGLFTFNKHKKNIKELVYILEKRFQNFPI